jgi:hypothetical protein
VRINKPVESSRKTAVGDGKGRKKGRKWRKAVLGRGNEGGGSYPESLWMRIVNAVPRVGGWAWVVGLVVRRSRKWCYAVNREGHIG